MNDAGIKVWVLTGDKVETSKCIARACNLVGKMSVLFNLTERSFEDIERKLAGAKQFQAEGADLVSVDGTAFTLACTSTTTETQLLNILSKSRSAIFARLSPSQKAQITDIARHRLKAKILAVGDGYNDTPMLLAADCGVRLVKPGRLSAKSEKNSDFVITQFSQL